jgi:hypothetical protein
MKGQSIIDHIHTLKLMTDYAEINKENEGAIIALDQEKAYDKIAHDYLWRTMKKLNFPKKYINIVQRLYTGAQTKIMINGVLSKPFQVTRGVRQGDPLSCLLFNIAIEPLACLIRNSNIKGAKIPNLRQNLKVLLFTDDTTVFLSKDDSYTQLCEILNNWCIASRAKFNITKTEIIPIGSTEYRRIFYETRKLNKDHNYKIDQNTHIAGEGELVRILGAWIGNGGREENPWNKVLTKVDNHLKNWKKGNLGLEGKRHAIQMSAGGCTQYLAKAQGMPEQTEKKLEKTIKHFLWNGKKSKISLEHLSADTKIGGRKVLDIKKRNLTIRATNLQTYLKPPNERQPWTLIADEIIKKHSATNKKFGDIPEINPRSICFLQNWSTQTNARSKLPRLIKEIINTAGKLNLQIDQKILTNNLRKEMPIWLHPQIKPGTRYTTNHPISKHLKNVHEIYTVESAIMHCNHIKENDHLN